MTRAERGLKLLMKLEENLRAIHWRYYEAKCAFHIFESLKKAKSPAHAGAKRVRENIKVFETYKEFLITTEEALRVYFLLELAKIFDRNDDSLSIWYVIDKVEKNLHLIKEDTIKTYFEYKGLPYLENFDNFSTGLSKRDVGYLKSSLTQMKSSIDKLIDYRNEWLAHDDLRKQPINITRAEIIKLLKIVEKYLDKLSSRLHSSHTVYDNVKRDHERNTKWLIKSLKLGNEQYKRQIEEKFRRKYLKQI